MTDAARKWKEGEPNYGLLIWATNEYELGRDIRFHSREHATKKPYMEICCISSLEAFAYTRMETSANTVLLPTTTETYVTINKTRSPLLPTPPQAAARTTDEPTPQVIADETTTTEADEVATELSRLSDSFANVSTIPHRMGESVG